MMDTIERLEALLTKLRFLRAGARDQTAAAILDRASDRITEALAELRVLAGA